MNLEICCHEILFSPKRGLPSSPEVRDVSVCLSQLLSTGSSSISFIVHFVHVSSGEISQEAFDYCCSRSDEDNVDFFPLF